jgi:hypothetical protein
MVFKEGGMTKRAINHVQEFLTIIDDGKVYQIVNVELLLRRHPPDAVIVFLKELQSDYKKELAKLIKSDRTDARINEVVAKSFRIKMAINTIKNYEKEVNDAA